MLSDLSLSVKGSKASPGRYLAGGDRVAGYVGDASASSSSRPASKDKPDWNDDTKVKVKPSPRLAVDNAPKYTIYGQQRKVSPRPSPRENPHRELLSASMPYSQRSYGW